MIELFVLKERLCSQRDGSIIWLHYTSSLMNAKKWCARHTLSSWSFFLMIPRHFLWQTSPLRSQIHDIDSILQEMNITTPPLMF
jgi:hypothetical protein